MYSECANDKHYRALREPLPYIRFVERSVRVPITGTASETALPIFAFITGLEPTEDSAIVGTIDEANCMGWLDVGGCWGSASR